LLGVLEPSVVLQINRDAGRTPGVTSDGGEETRRLGSLPNGGCRTVLKSVLTQLWCNPECVSQRRFSLRRAHIVIERWPGRPPRARHTTPMISAGSLGLSCVRGARRELTEEGQHQRPRCSVRIIIMLWTGRPCRRRQCWLWLKRKRATGPASAP